MYVHMYQYVEYGTLEWMHGRPRAGGDGGGDPASSCISRGNPPDRAGCIEPFDSRPWEDQPLMIVRAPCGKPFTW